MRSEFQKQNFEKILAKKVLENLFAARGHNFQPILKIPFWGRRYGINEQHTKKISLLALPGAEIFRLVQCTPPHTQLPTYMVGLNISFDLFNPWGGGTSWPFYDTKSIENK